MHGVWTKLFDDGSSETGTDFQITTGKASWTRGRLEGIKEVQLANEVLLASLSVPNSSWNQFDHFIVKVNKEQPIPIRLFRVVQAEVKEHHKGMFLLKKWNGNYIFFVSVTPLEGVDSILITDLMVGKWITLILPERGLPSMNISERGKFNGKF